MANKSIMDKCILCGEDSHEALHKPIDYRIGYVEGVGQVCLKCLKKQEEKKTKNKNTRI